MSARIVKILCFTLIVAALVCYLFLLNPDPVAVRWGRQDAQLIHGPLALILVGVFFLGVFTAAIFSFLIGVRYQLRDWKLARLERTRETHHQLIVQAREQLAASNFDAAQSILRRIVEKDPNDVVARIQLAEVETRQGKHFEALRILDEARASQKKNLELLFLAADLQRNLGNFTASADNLRLVLTKDPKNVSALEQLVEACDELEQFTEGAQYQQQLVRLARTNAEQSLRLEKLADLELKVVVRNASDSNGSLRSGLNDLLQRHRDFVPALYALGRAEQDAVELEKANRLYSKAYKLSPQARFLEAIAKMWLGVDEPGKAIANIRLLTQSTELNHEQMIEGRIFFICLLMYLEATDEAIRERDKLRAEHSGSPGVQAELAIVDAMLARKTSGSDEAFRLLLETLMSHDDYRDLRIVSSSQMLFDPEFRAWAERARNTLVLNQAPKPRLLTVS
ncbi:MAG: tetratricopeptide repeat protein [Bdellovibrionota bacterium]